MASLAGRIFVLQGEIKALQINNSINTLLQRTLSDYLQ